jgi:hypothetical protein
MRRRFLVVEFDFKPLKDNGERTWCADLIDTWTRYGMTALDAQAALIMHLSAFGPLAMVTFSGGKSLHAWFYCQGQDESEGSGLRRFMRYAARLGADTALYRPSQFARMPLGRRQSGEIQTIHFLNFNSIKE